MMIASVSHFRSLVTDPDPEVRYQSRWEEASVDVWLAILRDEPDLLDSS
jgi:hypothetical protein